MTEQVSFEDIKQLFRETDRKMQETDRRMQETDRRMQETDRYLKSLGRRFGDLGNRLGEFVEGMVRPGIVRMFQERGLALHETFRDLSARKGREAAQIDLMAVDETVAVAIEVKSRLTVAAVDEHLARMEKFRRLFPRYRELRILAAVAGMVIDDEAVPYAEERGVFVIGRRGDDAALLNSEEFEPRAW
jgi:hypothetical protein